MSFRPSPSKKRPGLIEPYIPTPASLGQGKPMRKTFTFSLALSCLVSGCSTAQQRPTPAIITADEALASSSRVTDCEWRAAERYDDGRYTVSALAQRIMLVCAVELTKARQAFHLSLNDPEIDSIELKQAVKNVEKARKNRSGGK